MDHQLVTFKLGDEEFGMDILRVQEIIRMVEITLVPKMPHYMEGVINLRGKVIPVVNLRARFNKPPGEHSNNTRIVVVNMRDTTVGLLVDSVSEVLRLSEDVIEPPPPIMDGGMDTEYIKAVGRLEDRLLILLDLEKIFTHEGALTFA